MEWYHFFLPRADPWLTPVADQQAPKLMCPFCKQNRTTTASKSVNEYENEMKIKHVLMTMITNTLMTTKMTTMTVVTKTIMTTITKRRRRKTGSENNLYPKRNHSSQWRLLNYHCYLSNQYPWSIHCRRTSIGGCAPYFSLAGMLRSSTNTTTFLPMVGP